MATVDITYRIELAETGPAGETYCGYIGIALTVFDFTLKFSISPKNRRAIAQKKIDSVYDVDRIVFFALRRNGVKIPLSQEEQYLFLEIIGCASEVWLTRPCFQLDVRHRYQRDLSWEACQILNRPKFGCLNE